MQDRKTIYEIRNTDERGNHTFSYVDSASFNPSDYAGQKIRVDVGGQTKYLPVENIGKAAGMGITPHVFGDIPQVNDSPSSENIIQQAPAESTAVAAPQPLTAPVVAGQDDTIRGFGGSFNQSAESMYRGGQMTAGEIARVYGGSREDYTRAKGMIDDVASGKSRQEIAYGRAVENMDMIRDEMDAARREEREYRRNVGKGWDDVRSMWRGWKRQRNLRKKYLSANEVTDPTTAEGTMFGRAYKLATDALEDAGGDKDKAIAALTEGESRDTWGDRQVDAAVEAIQGFRPTEGFGAFVGGLVPQMVGNAVAVGLSMNPVTAAFAAPVGMANMGMLTLASAGGAMADAESYRREGNDVSHGDILRSGLTAATIEAGTEAIPFNRYFNSARKVLGRRLGKEVADETLSSPAATAELTSLLSKHRDEMPRSIINKMNVREYGKDVVAEGLSEFLAEGGGALVQTIYSNPDDYPTLNEIIGNAWEGAKGGMFMGAFLGAGSTYASHRANLRRQEQQGFVELASTKDNGVVEIVGRSFTEDDRPVYKVLKANGEMQDVAYSDVMETSKIPYDVYREYMDNPTEDNLVAAAEQSYDVDMQSMRDNRRKRVNEYINIPADADIRFTRDGMPTEEIIPVRVNVDGNETTGYLLERTDGVDGQMARARVMLQEGNVITPSLSDISEGNPISTEDFYAGHEAVIDAGEDAADVTTDAIEDAQAEVQAQQAAQEREARDRQAEYESASPERRAQMDREDFAARIAQNPDYDEQVYQSTLNRKGEIEWNRLGAEQTFVAESRTHGEETAAKDAIREVGRLRAEAARAADAVAKAENESKSIAQINSLRQKSEQARLAVAEWEKVLNERGVSVPQTTPVQQMQQETAQEEAQADSGQNMQERQDAAQENIPQDNIPRDNDGNIDYDVLLDTDPAMFMQRYSEEFGADAAAEEVRGIISSIDAQIEKNGKALAKETSATKRAALRRQNAALDARRQALGSLVRPQEAVTEEAAPVSEIQEQNTVQTAQGDVAGQDLFTLGNDNTRVGDAVVQNEPAVPQSISEEDADIIVGEMEANAVAAPEMELTPANWLSEFGENGIVNTPVGDVKMGDNQYLKLVRNGRTGQFGMIKPTLTNPDAIIEVDSKSKSGDTERPSSLLFVKTFIGSDGKKHHYFTSVSVSRDGMEVVVSNHLETGKRVKRFLKEGKLLYRVYGGAQTEQSRATASGTTSHENPGIETNVVSISKDTNSVPENQDNFREITNFTSDNTNIQNNGITDNTAAADESGSAQGDGRGQGQADAGATGLDSGILAGDIQNDGGLRGGRRGDDNSTRSSVQLESESTDSERGGRNNSDVDKADIYIGTLFERRKEADPKFRHTAQKARSSTPQEFRTAISEAKRQNPNGWMVDVHEEADYANDRLILTEDGKSGIAVTPDGDIVSLFSGVNGDHRMEKLIPMAIAAGGRKLDCYVVTGKNSLADLYSRFGFKVVNKIPFNEEYAPADFAAWKEANPGNVPEYVVTMIYTGDTDSSVIGYNKRSKANLNDVPVVEDYGEALAMRDEVLANELAGQERESDDAVSLPAKMYYGWLFSRANERIASTAEGTPEHNEAISERGRILNDYVNEGFMTRKNAGRNPMTAGNDAARRFLASEWGRMAAENPSVRFVRENARQGEAQTPAEAERLFAQRMYEEDMRSRVVGESTYSYNGKNMKLSYVDGYPVYSVKGGKSNVPLHVVAEDTPVSGYYEKGAAIDTFDRYVAASQERMMMAAETDANGELRSANDKSHLKNLCEIAEKMRSFRKTHKDLFSDAAAVKAMDVKKSNERIRSATRNQNVDSSEFERLKAEAYSAVQKLSSLMDEYDALVDEQDRIKSEIKIIRAKRDKTDSDYARLDELRNNESNNAKSLMSKEKDISKADENFYETRKRYVNAGGERIPRPQIVSSDAPRRATIREVQVLTDAMQRIFPRSMRSKVHVLSGERFMEQLAVRVGVGEIINDSGDVAGFVDRDGTVYINADEARIDTPLHEIGIHRLIDIAEQMGEKELYAGIIRYGRTAPESIKQYVRDRYGMDESDPLFYEEVAAAAFGIENEQGLERFLTDETSKSWFARLREWLSGLWNRLRGKTEYADRSFYQALGDMSHEEIGRRLFDMVTSGKQVFEAGKAMESFMSRAVSEGIVDTEKEERLNKLRRSEPVVMSGDEYIGNYELNRDSAKKWMRDNLRGEYTIEDTGETVSIVRSNVNKVTSHSMGNEVHLKSLYAVPEMLGKSIFIEEEAAEKNNAKYPVYRYYVVGLKIGGEDYTAKITIGIDENGNKFYDHSLTEIEKTKLVDLLNRPAVGFISTGDVPDPSVTGIKDTKLLSILQNNRNIILSEYADAAAQQHRPSGSYEDGDDMINGELTDKGRIRLQRVNESAQKASDALTGSPEVVSPAKWLEWFAQKGVIDTKKGGDGEWLYQWLARKSALEKVSKDDVIKKINDHSLDNNPFGRRVRSALSRKSIGNMPADKVSPRRIYQWLVDSMAPLERMQDEVRRRGVRITDSSNAYVRQNLETSAVQGDMEAFSAGPMRRLTKAYTALEGHRKELEALGYTGNGAVRTAADDYLFALHAPERNRRVILNEMMQAAENRIKDLKKEDRADARKAARAYAEALYDGGGSAVAPAALPDGIADAIGKYYDSVKGTSRSGMDGMDNPLTDERAAELLAELDRIFTQEERKALVDAAREATEWTLDYAVNTGLISYRTRDEYKSMYSHYIPLRNWDDPDTSSVREREGSKPSRRRSSLSGELDVDMEAKGRESRAASPLVTLMQSAQNTVMNGQRNRTLNALVNLYNNNALKVSDMIYVSSKDISDDKDAPAWVANMAGKNTEEGEEHSIAVRVNGVQTRIYMFGEEGEMFMSAYKRLHDGGPNGALGALGATTRFRSNILTTLNPPFWLANAERDVRFGMRALYVMRNTKFVKDTMRNIGEAFIQAFNANVSGKPSDMYSEFMRSGGRIGFFRQMDSDQIRNDMAKELNALKKNGTVDGKNVFRLMLKHTRNLASVTEELMRYATYMTARQNGESAQEAAYLAHEVTANLSRRGTQRGFSAWSSFFNATMQGMNQLYRLYRTNPGRTAKVLAADMSMKLVSMLSMLAAGAAMMGGGGDDDDDEGFIARMFSPENPAWEMPEYVRKSAIVIPVGMDERGVMQGILIQNPHNFRAVTNIVDRLMAVSCGVMTGEEAAGAWVRDMIDEFAPFNLSSFADDNPKNNVLMFVPSALQPAAEAWLNTTSFGGSVRADMRDSSAPKYMSAKGSTNEFYVEMSKMLNSIGGGSTAVKGTWLNVSPESIDHIMESYLGFPVKMLDAVVKEATWTDAQKHRYGGAWGGLLSNVYSGNRDRAMYQEVRRLSANVDTRIDNLLENAPLYMLEDIAGDEKTIRAIKDEMRRTANMIYSQYRPMVQELEAMYNNVLYNDRFTEEEKNRRLLQIEDGIARVNTEFGNAFDERFWEYMDKKHGKNKE